MVPVRATGTLASHPGQIHPEDRPEVSRWIAAQLGEVLADQQSHPTARKRKAAPGQQDPIMVVAADPLGPKRASRQYRLDMDATYTACRPADDGYISAGVITLSARESNSNALSMRYAPEPWKRFSRPLNLQGGSCGQIPDRGAVLPIRDGQVMLRLQVQPELRVCAEPVTESQHGIAGDRPIARDDLQHAIRWHIDLSGRFGRSNHDFCQFVLEDNTWMNRSHQHVMFPFIRGSPRSRRAKAPACLPVNRNGCAIVC